MPAPFPGFLSYYKQRLETDAEAIRTRISDLGRTVERQLKSAVKALLTRDTSLAYRTIIGDHPINRAAEALDRECHFFIARHLPSAGHLRFISSALKLNLLLERMGDYAATIARESVQLSKPLAGTFRAELEAMAADAFQMFDRALTAYKARDEDLARTTMNFARQVDRDYMRAFRFLTSSAVEEFETEDLFGFLVIISRLERVSDQAKNICEETLFSLTGETKKRRPMRIFFLEDKDDCFAPVAVSIGRKFFSDRGRFESGGKNPAPAIREEAARFLESHGMDATLLDPAPAERSPEAWAEQDVIISLNCSYTDYLDEIPFLSVAFEWWLPEASETEEALTEAYSYLHAHIEDLIVTLRGEGMDSA
jgi:phosphate transport system protein